MEEDMPTQLAIALLCLTQHSNVLQGLVSGAFMLLGPCLHTGSAPVQESAHESCSAPYYLVSCTLLNNGVQC